MQKGSIPLILCIISFFLIIGYNYDDYYKHPYYDRQYYDYYHGYYNQGYYDDQGYYHPDPAAQRLVFTKSFLSLSMCIMLGPFIFMYKVCVF